MNTDAYKTRLLDLRNQLMQRVDALDRDLHREHQAIEKDFAEQASQLENDDVLNALDDEAKNELMLINQALLRIENSSFGICQSCNQPIDEARLQAIPYARFCIDCADANS